MRRDLLLARSGPWLGGSPGDWTISRWSHPGCVDRGQAVVPDARPGTGCFLKLPGHPEQDVIATECGNQLRADRQAVGAHGDRQRDRRLAGRIEQGRETFL